MKKETKKKMARRKNNKSSSSVGINGVNKINGVNNDINNSADISRKPSSIVSSSFSEKIASEKTKFVPQKIMKKDLDLPPGLNIPEYIPEYISEHILEDVLKTNNNGGNNSNLTLADFIPSSGFKRTSPELRKESPPIPIRSSSTPVRSSSPSISSSTGELTKSGSKMRATSPQYIPSYLSSKVFVEEKKLTNIDYILPSHISSLRKYTYLPAIVCIYVVSEFSGTNTNQGRNHYPQFDPRTGVTRGKIVSEDKKIKPQGVNYVLSETIGDLVNDFIKFYPKLIPTMIRNKKDISRVLNNCKNYIKLTLDESQVILEFENEQFCNAFCYILINSMKLSP